MTPIRDRIDMTLTIKESLELTGSGKPGSPSNGPENKSGQSPRSNPVCLEVPVTVRSLPGENGETHGSSGPVRAEGRTVIVFDNGAVLRLSTNLPSGQKVILSNAQGRDVVCRILSGRNLPTIKGYIEVEFMEPVDDYWRIHQSPEPASVSPPPVPVRWRHNQFRRKCRPSRRLPAAAACGPFVQVRRRRKRQARRVARPRLKILQVWSECLLRLPLE